MDNERESRQPSLAEKAAQVCAFAAEKSAAHIAIAEDDGEQLREKEYEEQDER